jgi:hypothetical protein
VWLARAVARFGEVAGLPVPIHRDRLDFVLARADYRDGEVARILGVPQRVSFAEAMAASWRWLSAQ